MANFFFKTDLNWDLNWYKLSKIIISSFQEKVRKETNAKILSCILWLRISFVHVINIALSLWEIGQTVFYQRVKLKYCWEWRCKETLRNVDKAIVTRPWHAMIKIVDLWKHHDATVTVFRSLFSFIDLSVCFISFNIISVQVEIADWYLLLRLCFIPRYLQTQYICCKLLQRYFIADSQNFIFTDDYRVTIKC